VGFLIAKYLGKYKTHLAHFTFLYNNKLNFLRFCHSKNYFPISKICEEENPEFFRRFFFSNLILWIEKKEEVALTQLLSRNQ
jgi:hypothetical protein